MNLLPKSAGQFNEKQYWESFFTKRGSEAFEWYGEYPQLCEILDKYVRTSDNILVAGCGNSNLSADMWNLGFRSMVSVDISDVVIRQMQHKYAALGMTFTKMDLLQLEYPDKHFTCVLDKGTLDALYAQDDQSTASDVDTMFKEVGRVLRIGGRYLCVSLLQPHILRALLRWFPQHGWMLRVCRCKAAETSGTEASRFPVFVIICTKLSDTKSFNVLEVSLEGEKPRRLESPEAVVEAVAGQQQFAFVRHSLSSQGKADDVRLELCDPNSGQPRFVLYVVDRWQKKTAKVFAIFIVQQGRETEWLFGSSSGRRQLAESSGHDRLVVVHLVCRRQPYGTLSEVQDQLQASVLQLRPAHLGDSVQVPFLACGGDIGRRELRCAGTSALSGDYIVEDVYLDGDDGPCRRLIFTANAGLVQSEARLRPARGGALQVDASHLCCYHHRCMVTGLGLVAAGTRPTRLLLVGLGGGGLARFLHNKFPQATLHVVDIDPEVVSVAKSWFGFSEDSRMVMHVADGLHYLRHCRTEGGRFAAVMFDVDSKDASVGMSCPPQQFVEPQMLQTVRECLTEDGVFMLNLAARDKTAGARVRADLCAAFAACASYPIPEEVNEVVFCCRRPPVSGDLAAAVLAAAGHVVNTVTPHHQKKSKRSARNQNQFIDMSSLAQALRTL